jgi:hypothetical protein
MIVVMLCNNYCSYATVSDNKYFFVSGCVGVSVSPCTVPSVIRLLEFHYAFPGTTVLTMLV